MHNNMKIVNFFLSTFLLLNICSVDTTAYEYFISFIVIIVLIICFVSVYFSIFLFSLSPLHCLFRSHFLHICLAYVNPAVMVQLIFQLDIQRFLCLIYQRNMQYGAVVYGHWTILSSDMPLMKFVMQMR